ARRPSGGLHLHEVVDLSQHTGELRALLVLGRAADLAEAERAERAVVRLRLTDPGPDLRDLDGAHPSVSSAAAASVSAASVSAASASEVSTATTAGSAAVSSSAGAGFHGSTSATVLPRARATSSGRRRLRRP